MLSYNYIPCVRKTKCKPIEETKKMNLIKEGKWGFYSLCFNIGSTLLETPWEQSFILLIIYFWFGGYTL